MSCNCPAPYEAYAGTSRQRKLLGNKKMSRKLTAYLLLSHASKRRPCGRHEYAENPDTYCAEVFWPRSAFCVMIDHCDTRWSFSCTLCTYRADLGSCKVTSPTNESGVHCVEQLKNRHASRLENVGNENTRSTCALTQTLRDEQLVVISPMRIHAWGLTNYARGMGSQRQCSGRIDKMLSGRRKPISHVRSSAYSTMASRN